MGYKLTLDQVLEKAIQKEIESRLLYINLSKRVENQAVKDAFQELSQQELEHQQLLESYRKGELKEGYLSRQQPVDYKIAEHLDQPEISPNMALKDAFLLAANRERASHEFYLALARVHPEGEVKRNLGELATKELDHKQRVEFLYNQVAFPQTDGG